MIFPKVGTNYQGGGLEERINFFEQMLLYYLMTVKNKIHTVKVAGRSQLKMQILDDRLFMAEYYLHILEVLMRKYKGVH